MAMLTQWWHWARKRCPPSDGALSEMRLFLAPSSREAFLTPGPALTARLQGLGWTGTRLSREEAAQWLPIL